YINGGGYQWEGKAADKDVLVTAVGIDNQYLNTFGMQLSAGRGFDENPSVDSSSVIINSTFAKLMGEAGKVGGLLYQEGEAPSTIIGITRPFVYNSISAIESPPLVFYNRPASTSMIFMKLKDGQDL